MPRLASNPRERLTFAASRSPTISIGKEPQRKVRRLRSTRVTSWLRSSRERAVRAAATPPNPPPRTKIRWSAIYMFPPGCVPLGARRSNLEGL